MDYSQKTYAYVEALEEEQKKIQLFKRELPLSLELVTHAIEACRKELSGTSEQTENVYGVPVFEEFIPINNYGEHESHEAEQIIGDGKSDWLRSVQLWNQTPDLNGDAFQPFLNDKNRVSETTNSSTTETNRGEKDSGKTGDETQTQPQTQPQTQTQTQTQKKERRWWSAELHRRFLHALQELGGSHVATPRQIREHMKVDGLTNCEVKSHLQKYRLHSSRPAQSNGNSQPQQQPQFVVVGGIWVPPPPPNMVNDGGFYVPVAMQQPPVQSPEGSMERSNGGYDSPAV